MPVNTVLVVDDTASHLEHLSQVVTSAGKKVITASCGQDAVKIAIAQKPDLVFLDIVMDDLDGYGACRQILSNPETANTPVIFVSTKNQRADRIWATKQGARNLISKPFDAQEIIDEMNKY